jgi:hypothetical protein
MEVCSEIYLVIATVNRPVHRKPNRENNFRTTGIGTQARQIHETFAERYRSRRIIDEEIANSWARKTQPS